MEKSNETVAVIGLGASGEAAARLALAKGKRAYVEDASSHAAVAARGDRLRALGADVRLGGHRVDRIAAADTVVVSPGIPPGAPVLRALRARGVGWVSEPEFAGRFIGSPLTTVSGSNAKTSVAAMCAHLLCAGGVDAALGGNVGGGLGPPASALALVRPAPERIVLELSSFQLADTRTLRADVGVMTNLGVDHMDRYATVDDYHRDKRRLFELGDADTTWVVNGDDPAVLAMASGFPGRLLRFSLAGPAAPGAWLSRGDLMMAGTGGEPPVRVARAGDLSLLGRHNIANALAALLAATASGAPDPGAGWAPAALRAFPPLPHRLESVGVVGGVRWVNDSKATNVAAAAAAVASLDPPLVLLLGGKDKGEDFRPLAAALDGRTRGVVAFGAAGERVARELLAGPPSSSSARGFEVRRVEGPFDEAVAAGQAMARPGDTLLLAPACSSFDMFDDYAHRGDAFRQLAAGLGGPG